MIWQPQPAEASSWVQKHFSLEQALLQQARDGHHSIFCEQLCSRQASSHTFRLHGHPSATYLFLSMLGSWGTTGGVARRMEGRAAGLVWVLPSVFPPHICLYVTPHTHFPQG